MTTPAINKTMVSTNLGEVYSVFNGKKTGVQKVSSQSKLHVEVRPASSNNPLDASGWRQPSSWSHSVIDAIPAPTGTSVWIEDLRLSGPAQKSDGTYYTEGAVFDNSRSALQDVDSSLEQLAIIRALTQLKGQKVNLGQAFAERAQTARLFTETVTKIAATVRAFRKKNPKKIWDAVVGNEGKRGRSVPNSWLEVQYGWKPLMADVAGAYSSLQQKDGDGRRYRATVRGNIKRSYPISWRKYSTSGRCFVPMYGKEFHQVKVRLDYFLENPLMATLSQLGVLNLPLLVWELQPYSFVGDWFAPIGDAISSMDAAVGWSYLGGSCTVYRELVEKGYGWGGTGVDPDNQFLIHHGRGFPSITNRTMAMNRATYDSSPLPRFPGFKNPLSTGHMANAMALLVSALGKHERFSR